MTHEFEQQRRQTDGGGGGDEAGGGGANQELQAQARNFGAVAREWTTGVGKQSASEQLNKLNNRPGQ